MQSGQLNSILRDACIEDQGTDDQDQSDRGQAVERKNALT